MVFTCVLPLPRAVCHTGAPETVKQKLEMLLKSSLLAAAPQGGGMGAG